MQLIIKLALQNLSKIQILLSEYIIYYNIASLLHLEHNYFSNNII